MAHAARESFSRSSGVSQHRFSHKSNEAFARLQARMVEGDGHRNAVKSQNVSLKVKAAQSLKAAAAFAQMRASAGDDGSKQDEEDDEEDDEHERAVEHLRVPHRKVSGLDTADDRRLSQEVDLHKKFTSPDAFQFAIPAQKKKHTTSKQAKKGTKKAQGKMHKTESETDEGGIVDYVSNDMRAAMQRMVYREARLILKKLCDKEDAHFAMQPIRQDEEEQLNHVTSPALARCSTDSELVMRCVLSEEEERLFAALDEQEQQEVKKNTYQIPTGECGSFKKSRLALAFIAVTRAVSKITRLSKSLSQVCSSVAEKRQRAIENEAAMADAMKRSARSHGRRRGTIGRQESFLSSFFPTAIAEAEQRVMLRNLEMRANRRQQLIRFMSCTDLGEHAETIEPLVHSFSEAVDHLSAVNVRLAEMKRKSTAAIERFTEIMGDLASMATSGASSESVRRQDMLTTLVDNIHVLGQSSQAWDAEFTQQWKASGKALEKLQHDMEAVMLEKKVRRAALQKTRSAMKFDAMGFIEEEDETDEEENTMAEFETIFSTCVVQQVNDMHMTHSRRNAFHFPDDVMGLKTRSSMSKRGRGSIQKPRHSITKTTQKDAAPTSPTSKGVLESIEDDEHVEESRKSLVIARKSRASVHFPNQDDEGDSRLEHNQEDDADDVSDASSETDPSAEPEELAGFDGPPRLSRRSTAKRKQSRKSVAPWTLHEVASNSGWKWSFQHMYHPENQREELSEQPVQLSSASVTEVLPEYMLRLAASLQSSWAEQQHSLNEVVPFGNATQTLVRRQLAVEQCMSGKGGSTEDVIANRNARAHAFCGDSATCDLRGTSSLIGAGARPQSTLPTCPGRSVELEVTVASRKAGARLTPVPPTDPPLLQHSRAFGTRLNCERSGNAWHKPQELLPDMSSPLPEASPAGSLEPSTAQGCTSSCESPEGQQKMNVGLTPQPPPTPAPATGSRPASRPFSRLTQTPTPSRPRSSAGEALRAARSPSPSRSSRPWSVAGRNPTPTPFADSRPQSSLSNPLWRLQMVRVQD